MSGRYKDYICVFDSGVGGISVLKKITELLPAENVVYFGDSANAPYGSRTAENVRHLTLQTIRHFSDEGVKAVVIACNTATSAAVTDLRRTFAMPVIGVEPALKPAVMAGYHRILVMATPVTLRLEKFHRLEERYGRNVEVIPVPGIGVVEEIEKGDFDSPALAAVLEKLLGPYAGKIDAVVLGCTHYPFIRKQIARVLGDVPAFDSGEGTARELRRRLSEENLLADAEREMSPASGQGMKRGQVIFCSSRNTPEELRLYQWFYRQPV
jgi:glutamate racemase